ncbi:MAG: hypothetical protein HY695_01855 [Deltaproteobacteria bacterium]|nr:hypothetical protein [Deltaproteobacteria bacterium]
MFFRNIAAVVSAGIISWASSAVAMGPLSDNELDEVTAQGVSSFLPIAVSSPTNTITLVPVSTNVIVTTNTLTNVNVPIVICTIAVCENNGADISWGSPVLGLSSINSPQTTTLLNTFQTPVISNLMTGLPSSGPALSLPAPVIQLPVLQVPTVQVPNLQVPSVRLFGP